jgi:hypothetical protein
VDVYAAPTHRRSNRPVTSSGSQTPLAPALTAPDRLRGWDAASPVLVAGIKTAETNRSNATTRTLRVFLTPESRCEPHSDCAHWMRRCRDCWREGGHKGLGPAAKGARCAQRDQTTGLPCGAGSRCPMTRGTQSASRSMPTCTSLGAALPARRNRRRRATSTHQAMSATSPSQHSDGTPRSSVPVQSSSVLSSLFSSVRARTS